MTWKRFFRSGINTTQSSSLPNDRGYATGGTTSKYSSYLPEVYAGHPNRIQRYYQYDDMDRDSDINAALDTIADFCTQSEEQNDEPFEIIYHNKVTDTEIKILKEYQEKWIKLNNFRSKLWQTFRNTLKNGDQLFLRDPETLEWLWVDTFMVEMVKVDEDGGKKPAEYIIRGLDLNRQAKFATVAADPQQYRTPLGTSNAYGGRPAVVPASSGPSAFSLSGSNADPRSRQALQGMNSQMFVVDAKHVVHLSLSVGMDINFPFGQSVLEPIFKTYKQKELLEDSVIIYRVQRAPERRIFYIDVGSMPPVRAKAHLEDVKNSIHQRRIPSRNGTGGCFTFDTLIPLLDGRTCKLSELIDEYNQGKQNWVYSCNPKNGEVVPGKITWAGETRKQAKIVKLTLDNGKIITCTLDHKFPILGKGFVEAKDLTIGESFIPAYFQNKKIGTNRNEYKQIFDNKSKKWKFVHRLVAEYKPFKEIINEKIYSEKFKDEEKIIFHHKDYNRYNNNPENLCWMGCKDHIQLHGDYSKEFWKQDSGIKSRTIFYDEKLFEMMIDIVIKSETNKSLAFKVAAKELNNNKEFLNYFQESNSHHVNKKNLEKFTVVNLLKLIKRNEYKNWDYFIKTLVENGLAEIDYSFYSYSDKIFDIVMKKYLNSSKTTIRKIIKELKTDKEFITEFDKLHENSRAGRSLTVSERYIDQLMKYKGYNNFFDFKKYHYNPDYLSERNYNLGIYNFNQEMLEILKKHYKNISENLHYTVKKVGFKPLYQSLQKDENFIKFFNDANPTHIKNKFGPDLIKTMIKSYGFDDYDDFRNKYEFLNHKLISIEILDELQDVGTITVDGKEEFHDYHTFALDVGIFTKNSILDAAYNPLCMSLDTLIPLLDGRTLTIRELSDEYKAGKENWIYSCDPVSGKIVPGNVTWAGVTRESAKAIKITLDNGKTLITTPDHKIPVLNKGFVEAQNLTTKDSLIAFNTRLKNIDRKIKNERTYEQVYDHSEKEWIYTHRMVGEFFRDLNKHQEFTFLPEHRDRVKQTIHHKDYNRYNNDPRNLQYMNKEDHRAYHVAMKQDYWDKWTTESSVRFAEFAKEYLKGSEKAKERAFKTAETKRKKIKNGEYVNVRTLNPQVLQVSNIMEKIIIDLIKEKNITCYEAASSLTNNISFMEEIRKINQPDEKYDITTIDLEKISTDKLKLIVRKLGYKGWRDLTRKIANYNHRIVSIEWLDAPIEVGTITVDGKERWHKHHTFATEAGIFVKNSMIEDYFFSVGNEGRGSKVEVLPGGDQTGEITDLSFFSKKLARGLRIPPSYLSIGDDGNNQVSFNDGKLGAALIQEFRFNKYCMRMQSLLSPVFDREFKYYLEKNGIEIDSSVFELRFNPPQNFTKYRQIELDTQQMQVYTQIQDNPRLSERFKLKRFLNLTEEELIENEAMWVDENPEVVEKSTGQNPADMNTNQDLSDVGVRGGDDNFGLDALGNEAEPEGEGSGGAGGPESGPGGAPSGPGGAPPPAPGSTPGT